MGIWRLGGTCHTCISDSSLWERIPRVGGGMTILEPRRTFHGPDLGRWGCEELRETGRRCDGRCLGVQLWFFIPEHIAVDTPPGNPGHFPAWHAVNIAHRGHLIQEDSPSGITLTACDCYPVERWDGILCSLLLPSPPLSLIYFFFSASFWTVALIPLNTIIHIQSCNSLKAQ